MAYRNETTVKISWGGLGMFLLFLLFLGLKLGGVIAWSWWWVTAPLWVPFALSLVIAILVAIFYFILTIVKTIKARKCN